MSEQTTRSNEETEEQKSKELLSTDFFSSLTGQPSCQTKGICDDCGRCQH